MRMRSYKTDLGEVLIQFTLISTICRNPNVTKVGNNVLVVMSNGTRYFLHAPDGDPVVHGLSGVDGGELGG